MGLEQGNDGGRPLNAWILRVLPRFAEGGGYRFEPAPREPSDPTNPRDPTHDGVRSDLVVDGVRWARAAEDGATYCCGMTLQVWLEGWRAALQQDPEVADPERFVADWFCPVMGHAGVQDALTSRGLGRSIAPEEAEPGDLIQYWRSAELESPSGHSAVFLGWDSDEQGRRLLRYWSSQPATGGIGVHAEPVGPGWTLHVVRAVVPASRS